MVENVGFARYAAEFFGTFILVFTIGCDIHTKAGEFAGISIGCVLMVMIYALGKSSGGNFNPAVSVALGICQKMEWLEVAIYVSVQVSAGLLGAICYCYFFMKTISLEPAGGHNWKEAAIAEMVYTFMLCFVVLNTAASKVHGGKNQFYGLAIGLVVMAGAYAAGPISMGCFNPAVAIAIDATSMTAGVKYCFLYTFAELIGACLAAGIFMLCRPEEWNAEDEPAREASMFSKLTCEFVGSYMVVLTVGLDILGKSSAIAFSTAAAVAAMSFSLASVSGGHFNPAVTTAVYAAGHTDMDAGNAGSYVLAQGFGGAAAGLTYPFLYKAQTVPLYTTDATYGQVCIAEGMFTFVLAFVFLCVATTRSQLSEYYGLAIGMCVVAGAVAIGPISGGILNPAIALGIASSDSLVGKNHELWDGIVYTFVQAFAGVMAAVVFHITHASELKGVAISVYHVMDYDYEEVEFGGPEDATDEEALSKRA
mmetsp:Transcript_378/g.1007  ORF Transcript_378/g.1007 Transcript_378/m.1007 type:complete len:480 (-) Transcript_378:86-1525(-)